MENPWPHFGWSITKAHTIPREKIEAVQLAALNIRLEQRRQQIVMLEKLAEGEGITKLAKLNDVAPLLFTHDTYKSYPVSLLVKQKFSQLSKWLSRLTPHDTTKVDVSNCQTIDDWLDKLQAETPLDVATSSGSSGTISFFPKSKHDYRMLAYTQRMEMSQTFGKAPTDADINEKIYAVSTLWRHGHAQTGRFAEYVKEVFCKGDESFLRVCFNFKQSTDLQWISARIRAAQARGDLDKLEIPPLLLERRAEWEQQQKNMPGEQIDFVRRMSQELRGKRVFALGTTHTFYPVAKAGLEEGVHHVFGPGSRVSGGGGAKGTIIPENYEQIICEFFGVERLIGIYGMMEVSSLNMLCEHNNYHIPPWLTVFLLDIETGQALPRTGVQIGRAAFFDMTHDGSWGGLVSGDRITVDWDSYCTCGRTTPTIKRDIQRLSELQGGDDKITCAAQPAVQAAALEYLTTI
jgi:hypothetical protein